MLRSLYTGISGMRSMQTMMDVTGNNIANVNTTGYKSANTIFEDTLSQTLGNASAPQGAKGGTNPAQVGLGVRVAGISTNFTQGATQTTGVNSDMLINGDGFFVLNNNGETQYTRNGAFKIDASGTLVTLAGAKVQGWMADPDGNTNIAATASNVRIPTTQVIKAQQTDLVNFTGRLDNTVAADTVDKNKITADATQYASVTVYDSRGVAVPVKLKIEPVQPTTTTTGGVTTVDNTAAAPAALQQSDGSYLVRGWKVSVYQNGVDPTATGATAMSTFNIKDDGSISTTGATGGAVNGSIFTLGTTTTTPPTDGFKGSDGAYFGPRLQLDFSGIAVANRADTSSSDVHYSQQNGYTAGNLTGWKVGPDGAIVGTFDNGRSQEIGKIAVATFDNPAGLDKLGGSTYQATSNSGEPNVGAPGDGAHGGLVSGALEMSNVDLATEFTNLIVAQRGFQASSRVITTSDSMLEELVNLKR